MPRVPRRRTRASFAFDGHFRGILQRKAARRHDPGYVRQALNGQFQGGEFQGRPGLRSFHGARFPAPIRGFDWFTNDDTQTRHVIVAVGGTFYRLTPGGDPVAISLSTLPVALQTRLDPEVVYFLKVSGAANLMLIYDGVNPTLKWDGNALTRLGIIAPVASPALQAQGAGVLTAGERQYRQTFFSGKHESNPSPIAEVSNTDGQNNTFDSPVSDDPQTTKWRLYRTVPNGASARRVGEADIGSPIVDNTPDTSLEALPALEQFVNAPPPAPAIAMAEHRGQIAAFFTDAPSILRLSYFDPSYMVPEGWPSDYIVPIAPGDDDQGTGLVSFHEFLVAFKSQAAWAVTGAWPSMEPTPILTAGGGRRIGIGVNRQGVIAYAENKVMFASRDSIYGLDRFSGGVQAVRLAGAIDDLYSGANFGLGAATFFDRKRRRFGFLGHG